MESKMSSGQAVILILDDEREIAELIGSLGRKAGFSPIVTTDPGSFQAALKEREPEVIVLDLQMPEMDGVQMLRSLAAEGVRSGVMLITGMDQRTISAAEQYARSRNLCVLGCLQKPFAPEELLETLAKVNQQVQPLTAGDLSRAISNDELVVYYQPTLRRFADGTWDIAGMEALVRWDHPQRGILTPDRFLQVGEDTGLIGPMTDYVLAKGIEQLRGWRTRRLDLGLRINLPARLITDIAFPDRLEQLLREHQVEPEWLTLEITETAMLGEHPDTTDILTRLRVKDINLAIDDFGIGYSSLTQLFRMPFNEMKIDRSVVLRVPQEREASVMVEALVELAHKLTISACAEGVETQEALEFLGDIGCDAAQGYFISPPVPAARVPEVIEQWENRVLPKRAAS
jgi:EAL domain-containing protein (putative c-di-GMP-specific phosphodiesterase class I)/CheY-like chemotaxis protein